MSRDNPDDLEMGIERKINGSVYKTANPPQCTGCERLDASNEPDANSAACFTCTRLWPESGIKDYYTEAVPDEPEESEEV